MNSQIRGEPITPVIDPNEMPSLKGTYSNMPVIQNNPNPTGVPDDILRQNLGLMSQKIEI